MEKMRCPICNNEMEIFFDTPLCLKCDNDIVYDMAVWLKGDIYNCRRDAGLPQLQSIEGDIK